MTNGYRALRESAALLDLTGRGLIRAVGEDRVRLLHAMTTNHIAQLTPGNGCYAFFLNAQGRILADVNVLCLAESLLLDTEAEARNRLYQHLDHFVIADDVQLEDCVEQHAVFGVEGPGAAAVLESAGAPVPEAACAHADWVGRLVVRGSATGAAGYRIISSAEEATAVREQFLAAGAVAATAEDARIARIENGRPRYGEDITESSLPQETQLMHAINFNKGCYLGQEIVERIRSRGHVNRLLVRLQIGGTEAPANGTKIEADGAASGEITSAVFSPALAKVVGMGYVRADHAAAGKPLRAGDLDVEVLPLPPA